MTYRISPQILIFVISSTLIKNMMPSFNGIVTVWTTEIFPMEESQPVFTNWSMIDNCSCHSCTKRVQIPKILELCTTFRIQRF